MFYVYVIFNTCKKKFYIGQTQNLSERLKRHNNILKNKSTSYTSKNSGRWTLIYTEGFNTRLEVVKREKELKSFRGRQFIKEIIFQKYSSVVDPPAGGL
ncbi:MAG: GIY-YIG nuclease family protein [Patescibacteria group bacterium]|nr:GIY-YIG nuclease family protein [Patescibacteria group bacterium]